MQTDATTSSIVGATMLRVVACVLAVVCKRMQQLPTMFGPTVHRGKDTTHKSLLTMRNECAWPNNVGRAVQTNPTYIVARRFGDHGTKEILGVVGWKLWPVSNFAQQHPTTCNRVCMLSIGSCCAKFETGQTFQPTTPNISFFPWSPKRSATMLDPFTQLFLHC